MNRWRETCQVRRDSDYVFCHETTTDRGTRQELLLTWPSPNLAKITSTSNGCSQPPWPYAQGRGRRRGRTKPREEYRRVNLEAKPLQNLLDRAPKSGTYVQSARPRPHSIRVRHIPGEAHPNETRPLGIPTYEDKILQRAVLMVMEPVYETDFLDVSHGFRPGRGAHGALDSLWKQEMKLGGDWIVDVDLRRFFATIDHGHLREFLKRRVRDGVILRLIGKWLSTLGCSRKGY